MKTFSILIFIIFSQSLATPSIAAETIDHQIRFSTGYANVQNPVKDAAIYQVGYYLDKMAWTKWFLDIFYFQRSQRFTNSRVSFKAYGLMANVHLFEANIYDIAFPFFSLSIGLDYSQAEANYQNISIDLGHYDYFSGRVSAGVDFNLSKTWGALGVIDFHWGALNYKAARIGVIKRY